ncbi:amino acid transporter [Periconia macrospinosa]|uniref:Amino acid transporter n=1 Tax=Periconia macrospinosa TaxID=97972 RepID=A0A2V1D3K0_9PLEO|nr:amino acid transporter [Periconia macrospinosa]
MDHFKTDNALADDGHPLRNKVEPTSDLSDADRALVAEFGYKPVFKREFGYVATFSFAVSIGGVFSSVATTFIYPLQAGGSASAVWCWLISGIGCMCIALSVSELVSAYPTCGGLYYTISKVAPKHHVPILSWITGWLNILGQLAGVAASEWGAAGLLLAAISISSDFTYLPTVEHTVATMAGMVVVSGLANSLSTYWIAKLTSSYIIFHALILVSCMVALLAMATVEKGNPKHTAEYVFTDFENQSGWPGGWSFVFGFLSVSWTMSDYDATAHIAEEIQNPELKAPWAISTGMLFTFVAGWLYNVVLCFVMGDITGADSILASPIEQPVAQIFFNVLGKHASIFFTISAWAILKFGCISAMQSTARTIYALSRDALLPYSRIWTTILPATGIPMYAVWLTVVLSIAINLIGLGSYPAIAGVFNVCAIALDLSYCIPILCKVYYGRFTRGPWHLGKYSTIINLYACLWTFFVMVIFVMPTNLPVTPETMNYAVVYLVAILLFSTVYWVTHGRRYYSGPPVDGDISR